MSQQPNSFVNGPATTDYNNVSLKDELNNKEAVREYVEMEQMLAIEYITNYIQSLFEALVDFGSRTRIVVGRISVIIVK